MINETYFLCAQKNGCAINRINNFVRSGPQIPKSVRRARSRRAPKRSKWPHLSPSESSKNVGLHSKTHIVELPCSEPYKTCWILIISEPKTQNGLQNNQKALGFPLKVDGVSQLREMLEIIGPRAFWSVPESWSEYLIKHVELWFLEPITQNGIQNYQKSTKFSLKVDGVSRPHEMSKKHWS